MATVRRVLEPLCATRMHGEHVHDLPGAFGTAHAAPGHGHHPECRRALSWVSATFFSCSILRSLLHTIFNFCWLQNKIKTARINDIKKIKENIIFRLACMVENHQSHDKVSINAKAKPTILCVHDNNGIII